MSVSHLRNAAVSDLPTTIIRIRALHNIAAAFHHHILSPSRLLRRHNAAPLPYIPNLAHFPPSLPRSDATCTVYQNIVISNGFTRRIDAKYRCRILFGVT